MHSKFFLAADDVQKIVAACKLKVAECQCAATIAVVDEAGNLLYLERMDGPGPMSVEVATGKARTAALTRQATKVSEDRLKNRMGFLSVSGFVPLQGGVPITWQGQCVGGVGISGGPTPEVDEQIAAAGLVPFSGQS